MTKNPLQVMVADDEPAVVSTTKRALIQAGFHAIGTSELSELEPLLKKHRPPVALLDNMWGGTSVLPRLATLVRDHPCTQFCVLSGYPVQSFVAQAFAAGARGFLVKPVELDEFRLAVTELVAGRVYVSEELKAIVAVAPDHSSVTVRVAERVAHEVGSPAYIVLVMWLQFDLELSPRQAECGLGIHDGFSEKEIAARLGIGVDTVHTHLHDACKRLRNRGVRNQTSLGVVIGESLAKRPPKWRP